MSIFSKEDSRKFYDEFGDKQDKQAFYEDPAIDELITHANFGDATSVVEFGCGTGRFAEILLTSHLPAQATYRAFDISSTMVELTEQKIRPFQERAEVAWIDGNPSLPLPDGFADRFVSNFVLDILSESDIDQAIAEGKRVLQKDGLLCLISITQGTNLFSKIVMTLWHWAFLIRPALVGGCRPIELHNSIHISDWDLLRQQNVVASGVSADVIVARKR
jgi:ubiquinone/menaquinone biosynthesis C-methylase UbiE